MSLLKTEEKNSRAVSLASLHFRQNSALREMFPPKFSPLLWLISEVSSKESVNGVLVFVFQLGQVEVPRDRTCHLFH